MNRNMRLFASKIIIGIIGVFLVIGALKASLPTDSRVDMVERILGISGYQRLITADRVIDCKY